MSSCGCCDTSCPSPVGVTITEYTIEGGIKPQKAMFSRSAGTVVALDGSYVLLTLPYTPINQASITVYRNSAALRPQLDYVVSGKQIYLSTPALEDESFLVSWTSAESALPDDPVAVPTYNPGYMQAFYSDPNPVEGVFTAWIPMDSLESDNLTPILHAKDAYAALWLYLAANPALQGAATTATHFQLIDLTSMLYNGVSALSYPVYIKT